MSREHRLEKLFDAVDRGLTADEAYAPFEQGRQSKIRGDETEQIVKRTLSGLPVVAGVYHLSTRERFDSKGIDVRVQLRRRIAKTAIDYVDVQVKSSQKGVSDCRRELKKRNGLTEDEFDVWRKKQKRIFLNGRKPSGEIKKEFLRQLSEINLFYVKPDQDLK